jgi:lipopolysaccharide biosynthesis glycosyltransferase
MSIFNTGVNRLRKNKVIPIFLTITNDYAKYAAVAIHSLTSHATPEQNYRIIILYDKLSLKNRWRLRDMVTKNCAIEFKQMKHNIYLQIIMKYCSTKTKSGDFYAAAVYYYRTFIARLFPQYEKAIYIDSDVVLLGDIGELFKVDLGEKIIAARPDPKVSGIKIFADYVENALNVPAQEYVNSGVLLMNLKKLRKIHYITKMTDLIKEYNADLVAPDQDYLNVILKGDILYLDEKWNAQAGDELPRDVRLVHYNLMKKPWFNDDAAQGDLFWNEAKNTRFYGDLMRGKEQYTVEDMEADEQKMQALLDKADKLSKLEKPIFG